MCCASRPPFSPVAGNGFSSKALAMRAKHIECCFMFGLVWSLGSTGVEAGQKAFLEFLDNIIADLGVIETEWEGVNNALQVCVRGGGAVKLGVWVLVSRVDLSTGVCWSCVCVSAVVRIRHPSTSRTAVSDERRRWSPREASDSESSPRCGLVSRHGCSLYHICFCLAKRGTFSLFMSHPHALVDPTRRSCNNTAGR